MAQGGGEAEGGVSVAAGLLRVSLSRVPRRVLGAADLEEDRGEADAGVQLEADVPTTLVPAARGVLEAGVVRGGKGRVKG